MSPAPAVAERVAQEAAPTIVAYVPREKGRAILRQRLPRRRGRLIFARGADDMVAHFRRGIVDVAVVDISAGGMECERSIALAREFPTTGFLALAPYRVADAALIARCAEVDFADIMAETVDDVLLGMAVSMHGYSTRFARLHDRPPSGIGVEGAWREQTWRRIVEQAGRPVRTSELAQAAGVSREHLSRTFAREGAPNLKRVIDLVRLLSAAELSKNPGYDVGDVARVLGFASSSHLSASAQRLLDTQASSLAALRAVDLIGRFARGRGRSRA